MIFSPLEKLNITGSISSILGLFVALFVLIKEFILEGEFKLFKKEEEDWHDHEPRK